MPRTMYDSTNPAAIPATARLVGGYTDGIYGPAFKTIGRSSTGWDAAAWARFPSSVHVLISAVGTNTGTVGDVEPGCMTIPQGVAWLRMRRAAGVNASLYCNQNNTWPGLRAAVRAAGLVEPPYWVANYTTGAVMVSGAVAHQYANPTLSGGAYDLSVVADFWPGVDNGGEVDQYSKDTNDKVTEVWNLVRTGKHADANPRWIFDELEGIKKLIAAIPAAGSGWNAAQIAQINAIEASITAIRQRVEKDLAP